MAVNIGLFFLQKEHPVHWLSHSTEQLEKIEKILTKTEKRIKRFFPEKLTSFTASCSLYISDIPQPDIIIESSRESLKDKRRIFDSLSRLINDRTLLFSNSSSILPQTIHPQCLGAHFFFPVELTTLVELIACGRQEQDRYRQCLHFFEENNLDVIKQDEHSAFLINRLLLPLQVLCFEALQCGFAPDDVEGASKSELISFGQLSMMDSIGLDIVMSAAMNYQTIDSTILNPDFNTLISSLDQLLKMGKLGTKNKNGLLMGDPLPWPLNENNKKKLHSLHKQFKQLLEDSCHEVIRQKKISKEQLRMSLDRIFHATALSDDLFKG